MVALTGKTNAPAQPTPHAYVLNTPLPEASAQTFPIGAFLATSAGSLVGAATGGCPTSFYGVAASSGQNLATDGAKPCSNFRFQTGPGFEFQMPLAGVLGTANILGTAAVSINSAGVPILTTGTGVSNSSTVVVQRPAPGWNIGDTNAIVYFIPLQAALQGGV